MFCSNCGIEVSNSAKFCPGCGTAIVRRNTVEEDATIKCDNKMRFVPAKCTQCGANVEVDPNQDAAVCKFCSTPFIVSKAINNFNLSAKGDIRVESIGNVQNVTIVSKVEDSELLKIMAGNQSLKTFINEFNEEEATVQIELIPKTVKRLFSSPRPGTIEDIDQEELSNRMSKYIKAYNVPRDEASLIEFFAYCNEKAHEELDDDDRLYDYRDMLQEAWLLKSKKILETARMLYPKNETFRRLDPNHKLDQDALNTFLSSVSGGDIAKAIGAIGTIGIVGKVIKDALKEMPK